MKLSPSWLPPNEIIPIDRDQVHIWRVALDAPAGLLVRLRQILSPDELARAERARRAGHRERMIVGRGALRTILARYLDACPEELRFCTNEHGKPALAPADPAALQFNLSHSGRLALIAVAQGRQVGVDVEEIRPRVEGEKLAARFFSPRELAQVKSLPESERLAAFYAGWTRKEATIKAIGRGLTLPLREFSVELRPGRPACLLDTAYDPAEAPRWSLESLDAGPGYAAALAVKGHGWKPSLWEWGVKSQGEE